MANHTPRTDKEIVEAFAALFDEIDFDSEEVNEILHEAGYDPNEVGNHLKQVVERTWAASPFNWRNQADAIQNERTKIDELISGAVDKTRGEMEQAAQALLGMFKKPAAVHFRNYKEMTDEELAGWLHELQYLLTKQEPD